MEAGGECRRCAALEAELAALRSRLARVEADYERLLRTRLDRDYERPPHWG